ncbi:MAG: PA2779 family protein [Rhodospirillales bacterium]|nr:PA2779 family protein [Rhodospirillales bacterium]
MFNNIKSKSVAVLVIASFVQSVVPIVPAMASVIGNEQVLERQSAADSRSTVEAFMNREDVRAQFKSLGVNPDEATQRVAALSDAEVADLAGRIQSSPAGQGLGTIVGAAVLIFIVLLITDLLGFTHVFGFTNKGSANPG